MNNVIRLDDHRKPRPEPFNPFAPTLMLWAFAFSFCLGFFIGSRPDANGR